MTGTIIEFIIILVAHALAGIFSSTLKYSKKVTSIIWGVWVLIQSVLMFIAEYIQTDAGTQFLFGFVFALAGQYLIFFATTKGRVAQRIFTILTYSVFFCISEAIHTMAKGTFPEMHPILSVLIIAVVLFCILAYFLNYVCPLCQSASKNISNDWVLLIFVNIVFLITIILSSVFPQKLDNFRDPASITYFSISISIMVVYPVIFSNINNMHEVSMKREVETQNKLLLAQIETETKQLEADTQARHDRRHHNLIMLEYANNNDIESVREYLRGIVDRDSEVWGEWRYCDNLTVNTILTVYERRAKENGISVNIKANVSRNIKVSPQDLVIVIANLFENAINAVSKLKNREKIINITVKDDSQRLVVILSNPCREKMIFDQNNYGVGISSIISTVNKYEGMYDFTAEGGQFYSKIILNL